MKKSHRRFDKLLSVSSAGYAARVGQDQGRTAEDN